MVLLAAFILVLHTASFAALMGLVRTQMAYKTDMGAAGEVMDALHRVLTYATVLEAAQRGYGFTQADIPALAEDMRASVDRCGECLLQMWLHCCWSPAPSSAHANMAVPEADAKYDTPCTLGGKELCSSLRGYTPGSLPLVYHLAQPWCAGHTS
jgi:hypothetical protein